MDDKLLDKNLITSAVDNKLNHKNRKSQKDDLIYANDHITIDISRNFIDKQTLSRLFKLLKDIKIKKEITKLFSNKFKSKSENKFVSHIFLRNSQQGEKTINDMYNMFDSIRTNSLKNFTTRKIKNIIHIGIGGSNLGPKFVCNALKDYSTKDFNIDFVSSSDTKELHDAIKDLDLEETIFIFSSKSFVTKEILINLDYIKKVLKSKFASSEIVSRHLFAVTSDKRTAMKKGIDANKILIFSKNIPGRFSVTSALSFIILLQIGKANFKKFYKGIIKMDNHFKKTKISNNIPMILAIISIWNINFFSIRNFCVCPYNYRLKGAIEYIQQIEMESNGKSSDIYSDEINIDTSPIVFGQVGTDCQHSFFQMIHQGSQEIALDFIGVIDGNDNKLSSNFLISNLIAQANLCFYGKGSQKNNKKIRGNNPSNIILMNSVDPHSVGNLISMYEHKIFVEGILWNINSFDQWGVEEGKLLASKFISKINQFNRKDIDRIILQLLKTKF